MSRTRALLNSILHPFGLCVGRIVRAHIMVEGRIVPQPVPTGWRAYRVLPLRPR